MKISKFIDGALLDIDFDTKTITSNLCNLDKILDEVTNIWATDMDANKYPFPFAFRDSGWTMNESEYEMYNSYHIRRIN
jgi:hypothetical protein